MTPRAPGDDEKIALRREQVLSLRASHISYRAIAKQLNVSLATVYEDDMAELEASGARRAVLANRIIDQELEHLAKLSGRGMMLVTSAATPPNARVGAIMACVRVSERRAKLLGMDKPTKTELTGRDGAPLEVVDLDLSELSTDERAVVRQLLERRLAESAGGHQGT